MESTELQIHRPSRHLYSYDINRYRCTFDIRESPLEEDDRWDFITVKLRLWKVYDIVVVDETVEKTVAVEVAGSSWEYDIHRVEVADDYDEPILKVSSYLTELGFPLKHHVGMIAILMQCIDTYIIKMHRYRHETVFMDIMELVSDDESISNEALSRSIDVTGSYFGNRSYWFCVKCDRWLERADGCMVEAVWMQMDSFTIWPDTIQVPWELDDDLEEAVTESLEEYYCRQQMVPASEASIACLEKVQQSDVECETLSCNICMNEDEVGFSRMPCRHVFHTLCVETWLRISSSCPFCRYALLHD
ncbi:unnamed protein product [Rhodiola kirilowii]